MTAALPLIAFVWAALNVAEHVGARDFGVGFWLNLVVAVGAVIFGIAASREEPHER